MTPVLLDTGVIVALLDRSERFHDRCSAAVRELAAPLVTCEAVIAEACHLLRGLRGAAAAVLENVETGTFRVELQLSRSAADVRRILLKYRDRKVDLADACLIHLANQLGTGDILTLDRDFEMYRWRGNKVFKLLIPRGANR